MAQARAGTVQQEREEVFAALQYAASFHCLVEEWQDCEELEPKPQEKWTFANKKGEAQKHHTEWCAIAHKYRCVRCGRSSKNMKMQGKCVGPKWLTEDSTHKLGRSRRAMEVSTRNGAEGKFHLWTRMFIGIRKAKETEETSVVGDGENSGMEEEFVVCEHIKEIEKEQSPSTMCLKRETERRRKDGGVELHPECSR